MMKKIILSALVFFGLTHASAVLANAPVQGGYGFGGFSGPTTGTHTVKSVKSSGLFGLFNDDLPVVLTGNITHSLGGEYYSFTDGTGTITVEIDHELWYGVKANPQSKVVIYGEVDNDIISTVIDVNFIRLI